MMNIDQDGAHIQDAVAKLIQIVREQDGGDSDYFNSQLSRYVFSVKRLVALRPPPARVLDIGSHYLHQAALLSLLGYTVVGIDVPVFTDPPFLRERAERLNIRNIGTEAHQAGAFLEGEAYEGSFDVIVCTEMLEHITFNPVAFWRRVWQLLNIEGIIYVTTPNSFRIRALAKAVLRLISMEGLGISTDEILNVITYGHHWKEYSSREVREYFSLLSPDFRITTSTYPDADSNRTLLSSLLELLPPFRSNIEAVIRLDGRSTFRQPPVLPMIAKLKSSD
jgi:2-polyprenyl-3-methyl-5-hydroxy-6-metoxy-1,4-benzoquinol methylase